MVGLEGRLAEKQDVLFDILNNGEFEEHEVILPSFNGEAVIGSTGNHYSWKSNEIFSGPYVVFLALKKYNLIGRKIILVEEANNG
ncbi:hypothetical protein K8R30_00205 [archaeon]|nr:hypothetical protein [archaeon]